ncbi:hypothetical protein BLA23254_01519 [Burkholderia lata]|uniref:Uncharacterized protein n=1 Tax=Burkholderia lata (strain ATCC 17760 / DSM 23089 / LMG 22485 / NCIMB 9086 / R18194 / 383) TaxID=482957 RepID=A0A6P2IZ94_BURL3|nr:hypothetical protein BLA23254_01519 [Burkholderia lata]
MRDRRMEIRHRDARERRQRIGRRQRERHIDRVAALVEDVGHLVERRGDRCGVRVGQPRARFAIGQRDADQQRGARCHGLPQCREVGCGRRAFEFRQLEPREQLLVAFVQAGIECVARRIVTAQPLRGEPQALRELRVRELARRRRDQQVDDDRDADRDRDRQPDVQQRACRGFAERREAELVEPEADDHRENRADRAQLAGRCQVQEADRQHGHARDPQDRIVDAEDRDAEHEPDHDRDDHQQRGREHDTRHTVGPDHEEHDVGGQRGFGRAVGGRH